VGAVSEAVYYFNEWLTGYGWDTLPNNMVDGIETNYASTTVDDQYEYLENNDCPGTDLGTITKVELRTYAYGDGDDQIILRPVFGGTTSGANYPFAPSTSGGWCPYQDITNDGNAPSPWTWSQIVELENYVYFNKVGKGNTMHCGKAEIRVTYTPSGPTPGWYQLQYTSEPPTPNAWNQIKQDTGTGWKKLLYEGE